MKLNIQVRMDYTLPQPADLLLQIEAAEMPDQTILSSVVDLGSTQCMSRVEAEGSVGQRTWLRADDRLAVDYTATVAIDRTETRIGGLSAVPLNELPSEAVRYILPSLYCPEGKFHTFVNDTFGGLEGGARVEAACHWVNENLSYVAGSSDVETTAADTFLQRQGICRDYAHLLISMLRASTIPARYASVYAPGVEPPDFHAVAEVYLDGGWHLVDPTFMGTQSDIVRIGVGLDAAEVSFLTIFGVADMVTQTVSVTSVTDQVT